jgi:hypothetical protein
VLVHSDPTDVGLKQGSMIINAQEAHLVRVRDTPVVLSHNEWNSDEHGNAGVQEGLTSR